MDTRTSDPRLESLTPGEVTVSMLEDAWRTLKLLGDKDSHDAYGVLVRDSSVGVFNAWIAHKQQTYGIGIEGGQMWSP